MAEARKTTSRVHLEAQIRAAKVARVPVAASFTLKPSSNAAGAASEDTEERVRSLVRRVAQELSTDAPEVNCFPFLRSFAITAAPEVVERLAAQPEIATAVPSRPEEDMRIRPVKRKDVKLPKAKVAGKRGRKRS